MTLSGYLIRRYWTGKLTGVAVLQATIIESDFSDFQYILYYIIYIFLVIHMLQEFGGKMNRLFQKILATRPSDILHYLKEKFWLL